MKQGFGCSGALANSSALLTFLFDTTNTWLIPLVLACVRCERLGNAGR